MLPYLACRHHPKLYRASVKLCKVCHSTACAFRIPSAALLRRRYCIRLNSVPGLPLFLYKCEEDLNVGQSLVEFSFKFLDEKSPIWGRRARRLFKRVVIGDKIDVVAYLPEQKCCYINPWALIRVQMRAGMSAKTPVPPEELARFIVYAVCTALLWEHHAVFLSKQNRKMLSNKAQVRFLLRCLDIPKDGTTLAKIKAARTGRELIDCLGITKDAISRDRGIIRILAGIQTVQRRISKAQAERKKRLQQFGRGNYRQKHEILEEHDKTTA